MLTFQINYFIPALALFIIEALIALFIHDGFIRPYMGDLLVVILLYCLIKSFFVWTTLHTAALVLLSAWLIELLQYFDFIVNIGLAKSKAANVLFGNSFSWLDILAYTLGILIVIIVERIRLPKHKTLVNNLQASEPSM